MSSYKSLLRAGILAALLASSLGACGGPGQPNENAATLTANNATNTPATHGNTNANSDARGNANDNAHANTGRGANNNASPPINVNSVAGPRNMR